MTDAQLIDHLSQLGWTPARRRLGATAWVAATRPVETAAGDRTIVLYAGGGRLTAEYASEGENALSACVGTAADVDAFVRDVERRVDATYARRLFLLEVRS